MEILNISEAANAQYKRHYIEDKEGLIILSDIVNNAICNDISDIDGAYIIPKNYKSGTFISQEEYNNKFIRHYSIIATILYLIDGIILCGGAAVWGLSSDDSIPNDFDLFIYGGESIEAKNEKIDKIIKILYDEYHRLYVHLVNGVITIENIKSERNETPIKIQIILRDYYSISEILHSFDIPSCSVAWDGKCTYMTERAGWYKSYKIIKVTPTTRSHTYELRLIKYYNKGYALLLPNLILNPSEKKILISKMEFDLLYINGNMAIANNVSIMSLESMQLVLPTQDEMNYDTVAIKNFLIRDYMSLSLNNKSIPSYNIKENYYRNAPKFREKNCEFVIGKIKFIDRACLITYQNILSHNIKIEMKLNQLIPIGMYFNWIDNKIKDILTYSTNEIIFNENLLKFLIGGDYEQFAAENEIDAIKHKLSFMNEILEEVKNIHIYMLPKFKINIRKYLIDLYMKKEETLYSFLIPINRTIELTGSLRPCAQSNEEWYGSYFSAEKMPQQYSNISDFIETYKNNIEIQICPICLCEIHPLDMNIINFTCDHIYHLDNNGICPGVRIWIEKKRINVIKNPPTCPECRRPNPKKDDTLSF